MTKNLNDISKSIQDIDYCMLVSRAADGSLAGRPMRNNQDVDYAGESYFFSDDSTRMVQDIIRDPSVGLTFTAKPGVMGIAGKSELFIHIEGEAEVIRNKPAMFEAFWDENLRDRFELGPKTPGLVLIKVRAKRIHYWEGKDEGEVAVPAKLEPAPTVI